MNSLLQHKTFESAELLAEAALALLLAQSRQAIKERGRFVLALAGGSTPALLYDMLAGCDEPWQHWFLIYGDERCLPVGDPDRNSSMVSSRWLEKIQFPAENHLLPNFTAGSDQDARNYADQIEPLLPLDMALLGIGEDGHTASLFPGHIHPRQWVVPVHNAPKPPAQRISLSYSALCNAGLVCFLVVAKPEIVDACLQGSDIPANRVRGRERTLLLSAG